MDRYEQLRQMLHQHPSGAPESAHFDEILRLLFTPKEVEVALGMGFRPRSIARIATLTDVPPDKVYARCESMANKGIVFGRKKNGEMGYALLPTIPGVFEFPFMAGGGTPWHDRLGKLWQAYHREALGNEYASSQTPLTRVIPIEQTIRPQVQVLPYEKLSAMLEQVETFALAQCACRVSVGACDHPQDVCLIFDHTGRFLIERQLAQPVTRVQAQDVLDRAEAAGLVHISDNSRDRPSFVCNCCPCCCTIVRGLTELNNSNAFARSRWHAAVDAGICLGCGTCSDERCPVSAVTVVASVATVDPERCIGCGLCATTCDTQAISLTLRERATPEPAANLADLGMRVVTEKGRRDGFLKLVAR